MFLKKEMQKTFSQVSFLGRLFGQKYSYICRFLFSQDSITFLEIIGFDFHGLWLCEFLHRMNLKNTYFTSNKGRRVILRDYICM